MPINFPDAPSSGDTHTVGDKTWTYDGTAWNVVQNNIADHGNLGGLGDDDHTQYALADGTRGTFEASGAVSTHEAASDPHTQYLLADGSRTATELTVTNTLTVDTNTLHVDSTNNRVGIGTASPETLLHVSSGTSGDAELRISADTDNDNEGDLPYLSLCADGGIIEGVIGLNNNSLVISNSITSQGGIDFRVGSTNVYTTTADQIAASTTRMFIDSSGNVGIGTTSPAQALDVVGNVSVSGEVSGGSTSFPASLDSNQLAAIEALQAKVGVDDSAVTTSLDYRVSQTSLVAVAKATITGTPTSIRISDAFSQQFVNYRIVGYNLKTSNIEQAIKMRFFESGSSTNEDSYYNSRTSRYRFNDAVTEFMGFYETPTVAWAYQSFDDLTCFEVEVFRPYIDSGTSWLGAGGGAIGMRFNGYQIQADRSYTDVEFYVAAGTLTSGTFVVYGWNDVIV